MSCATAKGISYPIDRELECMHGASDSRLNGGECACIIGEDLLSGRVSILSFNSSVRHFNVGSTRPAQDIPKHRRDSALKSKGHDVAPEAEQGERC
jgi:hypothetical protein